MSAPLPEYSQSVIPLEQKEHIFSTITKLSPTFIPNAGQIDAPAHFYTRGGGYGFYFTPSAVNMAFIERPTKETKLDRHHRRLRPAEAQLETEQTMQGMALSLQFIGSNPSVSIEGRKEEPGTVNFFIGNDPAKWRTNLHSYAKIVYRDLWPGIDMVFRDNNGVLKYEYIIQPGADVSNIRLAYDGADDLSLDSDGNLLIHTPLGVLTEQRPVSYKSVGEHRLPVTTEFTLERLPESTLVFGFTAGADYDPHYPLVIDPGLVYSTYLGGSANDSGNSISVDISGNAYVTGRTTSPDFPSTPGAFQTTYHGNGDAFVTKLNPAGSALVYSTYLGGSNTDQGNGITVDTVGNAYVTGFTGSTDFPTTPGAFQTTLNGLTDAFVTKLNPAGSALVYSTYLGGSSDENCIGIAIDTAGNAYVTGTTTSPDFPTTPGAFQTTLNGVGNAFVTKLNPAGSALIYSTYLGGSNIDNGLGIAIDTAGNAYVTGATQSTDFPTIPGAFQTALKGFENAFVTKLNPVGSALVYSTYLGGSNADQGNSIAVDTADNAYVTGFTASTDFPTTPGAFQTTLKGFENAFVTKLNPDGSALVYSTYLGGSNTEQGLGIAIDTSSNAYITGLTRSSDFPTTPDAFQTTLKGTTNAFVTKLNPAGSALVFSSYLGGSNIDQGNGITVDISGNAYVTGFTGSTDFPITPGAFQTILKGETNAFVSKIQTIQALLSACDLIISDPACRLNFGLDTANGPNNPIPNSVCHDICVEEVRLIGVPITPPTACIAFPPIPQCRLSGVTLPTLAANTHPNVFVLCADETITNNCTHITVRVGLLIVAQTTTPGLVVPFVTSITVDFPFNSFVPFPDCTVGPLNHAQFIEEIENIDGSCTVVQLNATVDPSGTFITIAGKIIEKLWKHENLWIVGLRPYDLSPNDIANGFVSFTVSQELQPINSCTGFPCPF